jgi:hypothetical protein
VNAYVSEQQCALSDDNLKAQVMVQYNTRKSSRRSPKDTYAFTWKFVRDYFGQFAAIQRLQVARPPPQQQQQQRQ